MDQASLHAAEARCTQEHMPKCQSHCPFHMDARAFMDFVSLGKWQDARKLLERHLHLPQILTHICDHPCESHCLRRDLGGSLAIQKLESLCMQHTQKQGKGFLRPAKAQKIAVLGNGLAGLTVAYELAKKSWPVTIFYTVPKEYTAEEHAAEENTPVAAFILQHFPYLREEYVLEECTSLEKNHATFVHAQLSPEFFQSIQEDFSALFVDAHAAPEIFASLHALPHAQTGHIKDHICAGGMLEQSPTGHEYASSSAQAGQGRQAALSIERILGGIAPHAGREGHRQNAALHTPLEGLEAAMAVAPASGMYTSEEAQAEAQRCIQCQCMQCVKKCVYLQKHGSFPRAYTRQIYNNAAIVQGERRANALVNGCTLCGQCTEICPERFSMAEVCMQAREDLVHRGHMPPSAHAFALEDMCDATQNAATLFMMAAQASPIPSTPSVAFFPGCQLTASRGEQVLQVYDFLCEHMSQSVGLMLSCCGTPAAWAGQSALAAQVTRHLEEQWEKMQKPQLILACASCKKFFAEHLPHIPCTSLWEVLYELREHIPQKTTSATYSLHDPCSARHDSAWQSVTRLLAAHCGVECLDSAEPKEKTSCCGYGGLVWNTQPQLAQNITEHLAKNLGQHTGLASCIMCRDRLVSIGKPCAHFLDILPFIKTLSSPQEPAPSLSARRAHRVRLVQTCKEKYGVQKSIENTFAPEPKGEIRHNMAQSLMNSHDMVTGHAFLHIAPQVLEDMEKKHILHQDAAAAVLAIEKHKQCFVEKESGHYVGAWRSGAVTFWVRYAKDQEGKYHLYDAWCHRMLVPQATIEDASKKV